MRRAMLLKTCDVLQSECVIVQHVHPHFHQHVYMSTLRNFF